MAESSYRAIKTKTDFNIEMKLGRVSEGKNYII